MILRFVILSGLFFWIAFGPLAPAEQGDAGAQARAVIEAATQVMGGQKVLNIKTVTSSGKFSQFDEKGELAAFDDFVDYIVYPDKERTEFGKKKSRFIQTNVASTGWIYDGEQKAIRDQKPEQIESFKRSLQHNLDNLLRRAHHADAKLRYLGEKEIWFRQRGRGVEIRFPVGEGQEAAVELWIDPLTREPVRIAYDNEEDRFYLYREFGGVNWPLRIDHYKDGAQTARISYTSIAFNQSIDPSLFDKPENPEKVK